MSNDANTIHAIESVQPRQIYAEDLYTLKHRCNTDSITDVYRTLAVYLDLQGDPSSPYEAGATSFDKFKKTIKPIATGFFFQFMLLFVENIRRFGGVCTTLKYNSNTYVRLVHVMALRASGMATLTDSQKTLIERYTVRNEYEDLQFLHDITYEMEYVRWVKMNLSKRKSSGGKKKKKEEEEENDDGEVKKKKDQLCEREYFAHYYNNNANDVGDDALEDMKEGDDEYTRLSRDDDDDGDDVEENISYKEWIGRTARFLPHYSPVVEDEEFKTYFAFEFSGLEGSDISLMTKHGFVDLVLHEPEPLPPPKVVLKAPEPVLKRTKTSNLLDHSAMKNDLGQHFKKYVEYEHGKPQRVLKACFTWSVIPDKKGDPAIAIAQVIIRSNQINVGMFQTMLIKNNEERLARINNGARGDNKMEMFPNYTQYFYRGQHPTSNTVNKQTFVDCIREYAPEVFKKVGNSDSNMFYDNMDMLSDGDSHLYRVLSLENALKNCVKMIDRRKLEIDKSLCEMSKWMSDKYDVCKFPVTTWKPAWISTFWSHPTYLGLSRKYMFHVDMKSDFLKNLCYNNNSVPHKAAESELNSLEKLLSETPLIGLSKVMDNKLLNYETTNQMVHATSERDVIYGKLKQFMKSHFTETYQKIAEMVKTHGKDNWRAVVDNEFNRNSGLKQRVEEVELYCQMIETTQNALLNKFRTLWPLAGSVEELNISEPLKIMAKWYQDNKAKGNLPHMTREFKIWDPEMDFFNNTQIQHIWLYIYFQRVLQPLICLMSEGLFSAYDAKMDEMSFSQIIHGRYDTGKTFTGITTVRDFSCIPGTVTEFSLATKASDTTRKHCYDEIILHDECPNWLISEKEAEKVPEQVNKEKIKATRGQLTQRTFAFITLPNGEKIRWNEDVVTDHKVAHVYVTNQAAESKRALSSRMHRITMKQCKTPANEMTGYMDGTMKSDAKMWCHINQYLTCCARKAAAVGYILPEVNMDLFDKISNLTLHYLRLWGGIEDTGSRALDIIRPYFRQLVYKMAIRYTFDLPSSPHYKKEFELSMMRDIQPLLYGTVSMIWWALTACASEYIEDDNSIVIRAMMKVAGIDWQEGDSCYGLFERDIKRAIKFKTVPNELYEEGQVVGDKLLVDILYVCLEGDENTLANQIAIHTQPRMDGDSVKSVIRQLKNHLIKPENGGYVPQPLQTLEKWHKYTMLPTKTVPDGVKHVGDNCPAQYDTNGDAKTEFRTINDMPCHGNSNENRYPVIDSSKPGKIYFIPSAVNGFQQNMLRMALQAATFCGKTRPGKFLEGFPDVKDPTQLSVFTFEQENIDEFLHAYDGENGFGVDKETGAWVFLGPQAGVNIPISRKNDGVAFNLQAALGKTEADVIVAQPLAPKADDSDWHSRYVDGSKSMAKTREVIDDLDYYSALQQHIACGRPMDEPVRDPVWIKEQYLKEAKEPKSLGLDYPHDIAQEKMKLTKIWTSSWKNTQKKDLDTRAVVQKSFNRILNTSTKLSRKERELKRSKSSVDLNDDDVIEVVDKTKSSAFENARPATFNSPKKGPRGGGGGGAKKRKKLDTGGKKPPGVGLGGGEQEPLSAPMDHSAVTGPAQKDNAAPTGLVPTGLQGFGAKRPYEQAKKSLEELKNKKK